MLAAERLARRLETDTVVEQKFEAGACAIVMVTLNLGFR